jgi:transaldolase / glucose-6-phosphate isomerase
MNPTVTLEIAKATNPLKDLQNYGQSTTFDAFRDHGHPRETLTIGIDAAERTMDSLPRLGISIDEVTDELTDDGVRLFEEAFDKLLQAVEKSSRSEITLTVSQQSHY